jgi:hypothetical protein
VPRQCRAGEVRRSRCHMHIHLVTGRIGRRLVIEMPLSGFALTIR